MANHGGSGRRIGGPGGLRRLPVAVLAGLAIATVAPITADAGPASTAGTSDEPAAAGVVTGGGLLVGHAFPDPVTWQDDQGRQLTAVGDHVPTGTIEHPRGFDRLIVTRNRPDGTPDPTWGTVDGQAGVRHLDLTAPSPGTGRDPLVAVTDDGTITTTWSADGCWQQVCDRWIVRIDAEGGAAGGPVLVPSMGTPVRHLTDGSFITADPDDHARWIGADGVDRGAVGDHQPSTGYAVDDGGRLLRLAGGQLTRRLPDGTDDLTVDLANLPSARWTCDLGSPAAVGTAPDDGIAVGCLGVDNLSAGALVLEPDGDLRSRNGAMTPWPLTRADRVVVDDEQTAWIAGTASGEGGEAIAVVQPVPNGWSGAYRNYLRRIDEGTVTAAGPFGDLRLAADGSVLMAEGTLCCASNPASRVYAMRLPAVPACDLANPTAVSYDGGDLAIRQLRCGAAWHVVPQLGPTHLMFGVVDGSRTRTIGTRELLDLVQDADTVLIGDLAAGSHVEVTSYLENHVGIGTGRQGRLSLVLPFRNTEAFVRHQLTDTGDTTPTPAEITAATTTLDTHLTTPTDWLADLLNTAPASRRTAATARLYRAFFLRDADPQGLTYWTRRNRQGTRLATIAEGFARSTEFQNRYGTLTNRAYVTALYRNIFDRDPDPAGLTWWTNRLDNHLTTRGHTVATFSESNEHRTRTATHIDPLVATWHLLGRLPTTTETTSWATTPNPQHTAIEDTLDTTAYRTRIGPDALPTT